MKDNEIRADFIALRAQGLSYVAISDHINVSKNTLLEWARQYEVEINNAKALAMEDLLKRLQLAKEHQLELLSVTLLKLRCEFEKRDLSSLGTSELITLLMKTNSNILE